MLSQPLLICTLRTPKTLEVWLEHNTEHIYYGHSENPYDQKYIKDTENHKNSSYVNFDPLFWFST